MAVLSLTRKTRWYHTSANSDPWKVLKQIVPGLPVESALQKMQIWMIYQALPTTVIIQGRSFFMHHFYRFAPPPPPLRTVCNVLRILPFKGLPKCKGKMVEIYFRKSGAVWYSFSQSWCRSTQNVMKMTLKKNSAPCPGTETQHNTCTSLPARSPLSAASLIRPPTVLLCMN